jgi:hypothetical protein
MIELYIIIRINYCSLIENATLSGALADPLAWEGSTRLRTIRGNSGEQAAAACRGCWPPSRGIHNGIVQREIFKTRKQSPLRARGAN